MKVLDDIRYFPCPKCEKTVYHVMTYTGKRILRDKETGNLHRCMNHIRIIDRRYDRRLMGAPGKSHTLCGGDMTDRDFLLKDAMRDLSLVECVKCWAIAKGKK